MRWLQRFRRPRPSYHDVVAVILHPDGSEERIRIFDRYGVELTCTRVAGWNLWSVSVGREPVLLAGEYATTRLRVEVAGRVILAPREES